MICSVMPSVDEKTTKGLIEEGELVLDVVDWLFKALGPALASSALNGPSLLHYDHINLILDVLPELLKIEKGDWNTLSNMSRPAARKAAPKGEYIETVGNPLSMPDARCQTMRSTVIG